MSHERKEILPRRLPHLLLAILIVLMVACNAAAVSNSAVLTAPNANAQYMTGQVVEVQGKVTGSGLRSVDVFIDNTKYSSVSAGGATSELVISTAWVPTQAGAHTIQLKGLNEKGEAFVASDAIVVLVQSAEPTAAPQAPATAPVQEPTAVPTVAPQVTATPQAIQASPKETEYVNVRTGPGYPYEVIGRLNKGTSAPIIGKNNDGTWWQISFPSVASGAGWVMASLIAVTGDTTTVVVASAPPEPTPGPIAQPPPVNTAAPAPTAVSSLPDYARQPYSQKMRFSPRDDIGDVPLGIRAEARTTVLSWEVYGATKLELEITTSKGPGNYDQCTAGNLYNIQADSSYIAGQRFPIDVPKGLIVFTIPSDGYYVITIYVTKADGSTTTIPRAVIVETCYKRN